MHLESLTIVGVGLIGGSIGLAAKARGVARRIVGFGRDPEKLIQAHRLGAIDDASSDLANAVRDADLVVFCTPVDRIAEQILDAAPHCKRGTILTDAGSTKREIVAKVEASLPDHVDFAGGHPIAGSEKKGAEHASADLFVGRTVVLTPTEKTRGEAMQKIMHFWHALGATTCVLSPELHDQALALTSHLPHLVASALAASVPADWRNLAGTGFRDTTRIASGDPEIWTPIFLQNRAAVLQALTTLEHRFNLFREALATNDTARIEEFLSQAKRMRDALGS